MRLFGKIERQWSTASSALESNQRQGVIFCSVIVVSSLGKALRRVRPTPLAPRVFPLRRLRGLPSRVKGRKNAVSSVWPRSSLIAGPSSCGLHTHQLVRLSSGIIRPSHARRNEAFAPLTSLGPANGRHHVVDDRQNFPARNAGAGPDRERVEGRGRHAREPARVGVLPQFARPARVGEQAPEGAIGPVDRLADKAVKIRIGDRLGGGAQHREATARTTRTAEGEIKRGGENTPQLDGQRLARRKQRRERLVHALPVLPISLQIKRALVAEGAVQARPVQAGRGADVVERGGGETVAPKNVHRLRERRVGFEGARPATASRGGPRSGAHSFLYHVEQNS